MARNIFSNPSTGDVYAWAINHTEEEEGGRDRNIDFEANTGNVGLVKQQGELTPLTFSYSGTILTRAQLVEMNRWFKLCEEQTIYFTDFAGDQYEVLIDSFKPLRKRASRNPRGGAEAPYWYWTYTIKLTVLRVIGGTWAGFPA